MIATCTRCSVFLPQEVLNASENSVCPSCSVMTVARVFPALFREAAPPPLPVETPPSEEEATCFQHASRRAVTACSQCGRYVCSLCELTLGGRVTCPVCVGAASKSDLVTSRTLWNNIALGTALVTGPVFYFWIFSAPAAVFIALRYWRAPASLVHRAKWRFMLAILIAVAELGFILFVIVAVVVRLNARPFRG